MVSYFACCLQPGSETIINRLVDVLIIEILRVYLDSLSEDAAGWMRGLKDSRISKALGIIHQQPQNPWTVDSLSRAVGMSRASFAAKFKHLVDETPHQYLTRWRVFKASKYLQTGEGSLADVAAKVGYQTEAAFSKVFKRYIGQTPAQYRRQFV